ncbi:MAG TPA: hypothetical protein VLK79_13775 [Gaiellales bacterium]|nr:hypothetical protein [Gaiellales bacterium]
MSPPGCVLCGNPPKPGHAMCWRCRRGKGRDRGRCADCGKPNRLLDRDARCRWCRDKAQQRCGDCHHPTPTLITMHDLRVCERCALRRHLDQVLPADGAGVLHPLRDAILRAEPFTTRRWLTRAHGLLTDLHDGRIPLDHAALDALPQRKAVDYLRALLISCQIMPPDPGRSLRRLEHDLPAMLADLTERHRKLVTRWIRWAVLPRLRRRLTDGLELTNSVTNQRRAIDQVTAFLQLLQADGRHLDQTTQHDIDAWFAGPGAIRSALRPFLTWSRRNRHVPGDLRFPESYKGKPVQPVDSEHRWTLARRLIDDDTLDPVDRVAGALVVLYAQPVARIVTLRMNDIAIIDDTVHLKLGTDPLELPGPFATLIQQLPHKRRDGTADQLPNPWLFASTHAGRHITSRALGERLRAIGIEPRRARLAAAEQLAREIPPAMLAGVLGITPASAARAATTASGHWANYPAHRRS